MDEEGVLDFLTSLEAMDLPDRIEEVNAKILQKIIEDTDFVAVLFCEYKLFSAPIPFSISFCLSLYISLCLYFTLLLFLYIGGLYSIIFTSKQLQFLALKKEQTNTMIIKTKKLKKLQLSSLVTKIHTT